MSGQMFVRTLVYAESAQMLHFILLSILGLLVNAKAKCKRYMIDTRRKT